MSTVRKPTGPSSDPTKDNPYFYGYRYVRQTDDNGKSVLVKQPLTREDALHPRLEDHVTQNDPHALDVVYLRNVLTDQVSDRADAAVFSDLEIIWNVRGLKHHGPDIMVIFGVRPPPPEGRSSFNVAQEGVRPELIIEVTSPATRDGDLNDKVAEYYRARVPNYVIVDALPRRRQRQLRLLGYERGRRSYRRMKLDHGRLWLEAVRLWLGHEAGRVVLYDKNGQRLEGYTEVSRGRRVAEQRADAEKQRAETAEQRADAEKQRADAEKQRAETAEQRGDAAQQRAETEKQRAETAEQRADAEKQRAQQLEAELRRLRGEE